MREGLLSMEHLGATGKPRIGPRFSFEALRAASRGIVGGAAELSGLVGGLLSATVWRRSVRERAGRGRFGVGLFHECGCTTAATGG